MVSCFFKDVVCMYICVYACVSNVVWCGWGQRWDVWNMSNDSMQLPDSMVIVNAN